ncbi:hypothetical protein HPB52_019795 [Rhipicephalus sanguineus]|uniref:GH18 domain-containing protein n=1 Tax=Rhipicephalus sanguineus TaxID=34632 RepID=A0A9D4PPP3_RHISA|nr:hypothetical protein HPB52_019795 [Rhipicephalus sanguineus]
MDEPRSAAAGPDSALDNEQPQDIQVAPNLGVADEPFDSQVNMVYQRLQGGRSLIFIAWVFCFVGSVVMLIPVAFLVRPLFSGGTARVHRGVIGGRLPSTSHVTVTTDITRISIPTFTIPSRATVAVTPDCRKPSPTIKADTKNIKNDSFASNTARYSGNATDKEVYCIFNISTARRSSGEDFLLEHLPWHICPKVIYWSLAVNSSNGHLFSRAPQLNSYSGFYNITSIARNYSADIKVLFTIGGYPEDSTLFSLLGSETLEQNNLLQMVIMMLYRLQFNGINIHLAQNPPCDRYVKINLGGLKLFIVGLRKMVKINGPIDDFKVTLMVGTKRNWRKRPSSF